MDILGVYDLGSNLFLKVQYWQSHRREDVIVDVVGDIGDDPVFPYNEIVCAKIDLTVVCVESVVQWKLFFHLHQTCLGVDVVNQI